MDSLKKLSNDLTLYGFFWLFIGNLLGIGSYLLTRNVLGLNTAVSATICVLVALFTALGTSKLVVLAATQPLKAVWQAIWHISPSGNLVAAPNTDILTHGRELATSLVRQIYELANSSQQPVQASAQPAAPVRSVASVTPSAIFDYLPIPVIALDKNDKVIVCNNQASAYIGQSTDACLGKSIYDVMQLSFQDNKTLESWINSSKSSAATSICSWDRVRLQLTEDKGIKQFDMVARYSRDDHNNYETMLAFFDHTDKYATEDNSTSYVAMAVHELRTPLTVLRGYIEVFEDELDEKLTPELRDFMHKMSASAQTLTAFVSNILNVARVDENQLNLSLHEANWNELLPQIIEDLELRAHVRGKSLQLDMTPNLPTVAIDNVSIYEVVSNLIENAIKYSKDGSTISIHVMPGKDGLIDTVVEDKGVGIPASAIDHLFTKFYRSHRSKSKVGGSGLGLYLVKAIVTAHGGNVWVNSKEGEGSSFGFSLRPYASVSAELKDAPGGNIEREAHGWIKNHSMYRR